MQTIAFYAGLIATSSILAFGGSAHASLPSNEPTTAATASPSPTDVARKGADDKNSNERHGKGRDDGPNHAQNAPTFLMMARHGADDGAGHNRHGHGADDGAGDDHGRRRG